MNYLFFLILFLVTSCAGNKRTIMSGKGISMTREHLENDEKLKDLKRFNTKSCVVPFNRKIRYMSDLVERAQKFYKADFIKDFKISSEMVNLFKICYYLEGTPSRAIKISSAPNVVTPQDK